MPRENKWAKREQRSARRTAWGFDNVDADDRCNIVAGHAVPDRWRMLGALRDCLPAIPLDGRDVERVGDEVHVWALAELFYMLKRESRMIWGRGVAGDAYFPSGRPKEGKRRGRWAGDRLNLLLNRLDPDFIDPRFRQANIAHGIDQMRRRLYRRIIEDGLYVEQSWLVLRILADVHAKAGQSVPPQELAGWYEQLRRGCSVETRVLQSPFTRNSVPETLAYYGVGDTVQRHGERGYRIRYVHVEALERMRRARGTIDLRYLHWMRDRYGLAT